MSPEGAVKWDREGEAVSRAFVEESIKSTFAISYESSYTSPLLSLVHT